MEWNEELEKKLQRRGEIWHAEKLASRLIFDGRRALEHYTADEMRAKFEPIAKQYNFAATLGNCKHKPTITE